MNIFYLSTDPHETAVAHVDKHVLKQVIETAQMLSTAHHVLDGESVKPDILKKAYANHPCTVWVRGSNNNYNWAYALFTALLGEYTHRYGKTHALSRLTSGLASPPTNIEVGPLAPPAQAMPDQYKQNDFVEAYRAYYREGKKHLHKWTKRNTPEWL